MRNRPVQHQSIAPRAVFAIAAGLVLLALTACGSGEPPDDLVDSQTHWRDLLSGDGVPGLPERPSGDSDGGDASDAPEPDHLDNGNRVFIETPDRALLVVQNRGVFRWSTPRGQVDPVSPEPLLRTSPRGRGRWLGDAHFQRSTPWTASPPLALDGLDRPSASHDLLIRPESAGLAAREIPAGSALDQSIALVDDVHLVRMRTDRERVWLPNGHWLEVPTTHLTVRLLADAGAEPLNSVEFTGLVTATAVSGRRIALAGRSVGSEPDWEPSSWLRIVDVDANGTLLAGPRLDHGASIDGQHNVRWRGERLEALAHVATGAEWREFEIDDEREPVLATSLGLDSTGERIAELVGDEQDSLAITDSDNQGATIHMVRRQGETLTTPVKVVTRRVGPLYERFDPPFSSIAGRLGSGRWLLVEPQADSAVHLRILDLDAEHAGEPLVLAPPSSSGGAVERSVPSPRLVARAGEHGLDLGDERAWLVAVVWREIQRYTWLETHLQLVVATPDELRTVGTLRHPGTVFDWSFDGAGRVVTIGNEAAVWHDLSDLSSPTSGRPLWLTVTTRDLIPVGDALLRRVWKLPSHLSVNRGDGWVDRVERFRNDEAPWAVHDAESIEIPGRAAVVPWGERTLVLSRAGNEPQSSQDGLLAIDVLDMDGATAPSLTRLGELRTALARPGRSIAEQLTGPLPGLHYPGATVIEDVLVLSQTTSELVAGGMETVCRSQRLRSSAPWRNRLCEDEYYDEADADDGADDQDQSAEPESGAHCFEFYGERSCSTNESGTQRCHGEDLLCEHQNYPRNTDQRECRFLTAQEREAHVVEYCEERTARRTETTHRLLRVDLADPDGPRALEAPTLAAEERTFGLLQHENHAALVTAESVPHPEGAEDLVRWSMRQLHPDREGADAVGPRVDTPGRLVARFDDLLITLRQQPDDTEGRNLVLHLSRLDGNRIRLLDSHVLDAGYAHEVWASSLEHIVIRWVQRGGPAQPSHGLIQWLRVNPETERCEAIAGASGLRLRIHGLQNNVLLLAGDYDHALYQVPLTEGAPLEATLTVLGHTRSLVRLLHRHGLWHVAMPEPLRDPAMPGW